jgi:hypothetical protein
MNRTVRGIVTVAALSFVIASCWLSMAGALTAQTGESPSGRQASPQSGGLPPVPRNATVVELEKKLAGQENKPAEEVFKNIRLFKGQPAIRVLRVMEFGFAPALGVDCTHCHVQDQWEKDDKEAKQTARKMWGMMFKITQELLEGKGAVNCYTCHRGQVKPALNPTQAK